MAVNDNINELRAHLHENMWLIHADQLEHPVRLGELPSSRVQLERALGVHYDLLIKALSGERGVTWRAGQLTVHVKAGHVTVVIRTSAHFGWLSAEAKEPLGLLRVIHACRDELERLSAA